MENLDDKEKDKHTHTTIAVADTSDKKGPKKPKQLIETLEESDQETPIFSIKKPSPQRKVQKVQIVRSNGGKTQVRGLLPGQKLVQMPDGKLQLFSPPNVPQQQQPQSQQQPISTFGNMQTQNNAGQKQMVLVDSKVIQPGTKKVFISKDGKIIGECLVQQHPSPFANQQEKAQIVLSSDGKSHVLLPGQQMQMVQMPDGKLQIFSQPNAPQQQQPQPPLPQQYSKNTNSGHRSRNEKSKVEIVPATGEPMDEEWDVALMTPTNPLEATDSVASPNMIASSNANMNNVAPEVPSVVNYLKRFTEVINKEAQFENKSPKRAKMNLMEKPKERNDSENEDLLSLTGNIEAKDNLMNEYDKKFENLQLEIENLKKQNTNHNLNHNGKVLAQSENLKKDIIIDEIKELYEKLEYFQQENADLIREHEKEILLLKKENTELKEKLHAKTATDETNDSLNFVQETVINPSEFQQETVMNTDITIKEEPIE